MRARGGQEARPVATAGSRKAATTSDGATLVQACRQVAVGAGHGMLPQLSQWLQGCSPIALFSAPGRLEAAAAAAVMKPPAKTARQPRTAARARKRFIGLRCAAELALPIAARSQLRDVTDIVKVAWSIQIPDETTGALDLANYERHQVRLLLAKAF